MTAARDETEAAGAVGVETSAAGNGIAPAWAVVHSDHVDRAGLRWLFERSSCDGNSTRVLV
jgi:hypothetical protein